MALTTTTNSSAIPVDAGSIVVASATGFAAGSIVRVNGEFMQVASSYVSGTTIPVKRGQDGTKTSAHPVTSNVTVGLASDFGNPPAGVSAGVTISPSMSVGVTAYNAAGALSFGATQWTIAILNGTVARAMTLAAPTKDQDGYYINIVGNGKAAHTVTIAGGIGAAGSGYTVVTMITGSQAGLLYVAANGAWVAASSQYSGTLTATLAALA